jgi:hypothetical protein
MGLNAYGKSELSIAPKTSSFLQDLLDFFNA